MKKLKFSIVGFVLASVLSLGTAHAGPATPVIAAGEVMETVATNPDIIQVKGCHSNKKWHMVNKWGKKAWHRHGYNCQPKHVAKKKGKHCHKTWKKHWHQGWGTKWHKHAGPNCHYKKGNTFNNNYGNGCIKIGKIWICQ